MGSGIGDRMLGEDPGTDGSFFCIFERGVRLPSPLIRYIASLPWKGTYLFEFEECK
jgi:hypothetical protein